MAAVERVWPVGQSEIIGAALLVFSDLDPLAQGEAIREATAQLQTRNPETAGV